MSEHVHALGPNSPSDALTCRWCGHAHRRVPLGPGERAICVRCGSVLQKRGRLGPDAALAFTVTGILLAIPSAVLPFVTVDKVRAERVGLLLTGADALWEHGMRLLAVWVMACGTLAPLVLLGTLAALLLPEKFGWPVTGRRLLARTAHAVAHWAMPEVHILAVLVTVSRLGVLVNVHIESGLWFYAAMSAMILLAWRSFELDSVIIRKTRSAAASTPP